MSNASISRRHFLKTAGGLFVFSSTLASKRSFTTPPTSEQGMALGDLSNGGIVLWSRTNQTSTWYTEWSRYEDFRYTHKLPPVDAYATQDYTVKLGVPQLPADTDIYVRSYFRSKSTGQISDRCTAQFRTPSTTPSRSLKFAWSGDLGGQGFGINPDIGGYRIFSEIAKERPDLFVNCGDVIYADAPLKLERKLPSNELWYNLVTPEKERVAESLAQFRGNYRYNYLDQNFKAFSAQCPQIYTWDDHETKNNWWPSLKLRDIRYRERRCGLLSNWARQSFFEYLPVAQSLNHPRRLYRKLSQGPLADVFVLDTRSYRGPNSAGSQRRLTSKTALLGATQLSWLLKSLKQSTALWKLIVCPQPIGINVYGGPGIYDGIGNGSSKSPTGRELEFARLLSELKRAHVQNTVWLTADVHYAAAHHYQPIRAAFKDFLPFWEFLAGPLNAGTFGPNSLDATFGPEVVFQSVPRGIAQGLSPLSPYQFFGVGEIDPASGNLTIRFKNQLGEQLWSRELESQG